MKANDEMMHLMARRFKAMSEPLRLRILQLLKEGERSVGEIAEILDLKHGTASANMNALAKAKLVSFRRQGTKVYYRISNQMILQICDIACDCINQEINDLVNMNKEIG